MISTRGQILPTPDGVTVYGHPWPRDTAIEVARRLRGAAEVWPLRKAKERTVGHVTITVDSQIRIRTEDMGEIYGGGEWALAWAAGIEMAIEEGMVAA